MELTIKEALTQKVSRERIGIEVCAQIHAICSH